MPRMPKVLLRIAPISIARSQTEAAEHVGRTRVSVFLQTVNKTEDRYFIVCMKDNRRLFEHLQGKTASPPSDETILVVRAAN